MKTNSIYEALNNVDDKFVSEAAKAHGKRPMALMITAASLAAALAIAVGIRNWGGTIGNYISPADSPVNQSGVSYEASDFGESDSLDNKFEVTTADGKRCYWNLHNQNITIPEEFDPANNNDLPSFFNVKIRPEEIFAKFGVSPITNENFINIADLDGELYEKYISHPQWSNVESSVFVADSYIQIDYYLFNKNIGKTVRFSTEYLMESPNGRYGGCAVSRSWDTITMKDGSIGFVNFDSAIFAHNNVKYYFIVSGPDDGDINQVLTDLGVL